MIYVNEMRQVGEKNVLRMYLFFKFLLILRDKELKRTFCKFCSLLYPQSDYNNPKKYLRSGLKQKKKP